MNNIMIDLETLGTGSKARIISIGAVKFDEVGLTSQFYTTNIDPGEYSSKFDTDHSALEFWMTKASQEARDALFIGTPVPLEDSLLSLSGWMGDNPIVWGNGADFDISILGHSYEVIGIKRPWNHWNVRCYRTVKNISINNGQFSNPPQIKIQGTHHNALDDAKNQANHLIELSKYWWFNFSG